VSLPSTNVQIQNKDGRRYNVVPRGASILAGGTAEKVSESVERLFKHLRTLLERLKEQYEKSFGRGSWPDPNPAHLNLSLLGNQCLLMTDTCNTARASRRRLAKLVEKAVEKTYDASFWAALSKEQQLTKMSALGADCRQHMRNIFLDAMAAASNAHVKTKLEDSLEEFSAHERIDPDMLSIIRAAYKQFHHGVSAPRLPSRFFTCYHPTNAPAGIC
jgi:hypothetical protein